MRIYCIIIVVCLFFGTQFNLKAQDLDFTQYYSLPTFLNPALTGNFNGTYRVGGAYRDQWRSASAVPLSTYSFNGEYRVKVGEGRSRADYVGLGMKFYSDRARLLEHNTNSVALAIAFHKSLSSQHVEYLSIGFEAGIVQKNLNYQYLQFEDQWNNINAFSSPTQEMLELNNFGFADFSLGVNYLRHIDKRNQVHAGVSLKHLTTPNVSFWRDTENSNPELISISKLPILVGFHLLTTHELSYQFSLSPRLSVQYQGPHLQIMTGSTLRIDLGSYTGSALHVGAFGRFTNTQDGSIYLATLSPFVGFEISDFLVGVSYDFLVSDVLANFKNISVLEFTVRYTGETIEASAICPEF